MIIILLPQGDGDEIEGKIGGFDFSSLHAPQQPTLGGRNVMWNEHEIEALIASYMKISMDPTTDTDQAKTIRKVVGVTVVIKSLLTVVEVKDQGTQMKWVQLTL